MRRITIYLFTAVTGAAFPIHAQPIADDDRSAGRQVAMEICSSCHRVAAGQLAPIQNTPSFVDIANMPSTTALSLKVFLRSNHKRMPNFIISDSDTDDVIGYILSLKQQ
ncbi:MAG TPA: cytochrome c [Pseudolabrys sp.]|nr:cytochrome c [Pseudolabrys sp.]